ncbi:MULTISPECIES: hypothetical protein [unclassified Streptomyces]|uniref:hypothetical protein n=1 Tax=unclassified Streptomyces TaxID=2593676 RepID=UPI00093B85AE|nr:hypothetical protein [Streptomyces sp. TSRI0281]OKI44794.1 hypothetical protein A6A29_34250 [Streptomyces sp. TSRI0281]
MTHPSLLPAIAAPRPAPARPLDLRVHVQHIQVDDLTVTDTDPSQVLAHARQAVRTQPDTGALLGHGSTTPLTLPAAAALLCALHDLDDLTDMGLCTPPGTPPASARPKTSTVPVTLELSDTPDRES